MTQPIGEQRVERAASAVALTDCCFDRLCTNSFCPCRKIARAALEADAPALREAKIEGLREARELASAGHFLVKEPETIGEGVAFHVCRVVEAIDARIAALQAEEQT